MREGGRGETPSEARTQTALKLQGNWAEAARCQTEGAASVACGQMSSAGRWESVWTVLVPHAAAWTGSPARSPRVT